MTESATNIQKAEARRARREPRRLAIRLGLFVMLIVVALTLWVTNNTLTARFTETTRNRAELRVALYAGNIMAELRRSAIVPQLLARDPALIGALNSGAYQQSSARLISFVEEIGAASLLMMDLEGRVVAATDRARLGKLFRNSAFFVDALRARDTVFVTTQHPEINAYSFFYARRVEAGGRAIGVIAVEVDLAKFETAWSGIADAVIVTESEGTVILATEPRWRGRIETDALADTTPISAIERTLRATARWQTSVAPSYLDDRPVIRTEGRLPHRGWRIVTYTPYASVRERVNGVMALQIMGFAMAVAFGFFLLNRATVSRMTKVRRESAELRALNSRLNREISERQKMQRELAVAEASLEQNSKLAALGEMSAAISHELNQPLAAMKTYLAGARLLLTRRRPEEALASFHRIDHLIDRMSGITRQLKSYARKGGDKLAPIELREVLNSALSIMEPMLRERQVRLSRIVDPEPVIVLADRLRLEQVVINLVRNAIDATSGRDEPQLEVLVTSGEMAQLSVRDNGHGIEDLEQLFEPFYTTKAPGEGVGLGLAISSGIIRDLGGRLTARNANDGGAIFEISLPLAPESPDSLAAPEPPA